MILTEIFFLCNFIAFNIIRKSYESYYEPKPLFEYLLFYLRDFSGNLFRLTGFFFLLQVNTWTSNEFIEEELVVS